MYNYSLIDSMCNRINFEIESVKHINHNDCWFEKTVTRCYSVWIIKDNDVVIERNGSALEAHKGDVFLFAPQQFYTAKCPVEGCSYIRINFNAFIGNNSRPFKGFNIDGLTKYDNVKSVISYILVHLDLLNKSAPLHLWALKADLILLIRKIFIHNDERTYSYGKIENHLPQLKVERLITYITENIEKQITIKELASIMCLSEKYLITYFRHNVGKTPHAYITEIKLQRAFDYLCEKKYSVKETAQMLGYRDQDTFSKAFKRHYGFPPSSV